MAQLCQECGKITRFEELTHCSELCLFEEIKNSKSISRTPYEEWNNRNYWF